MYVDQTLVLEQGPHDPNGELGAIAQYLDGKHHNGNIKPKETVPDYCINLRLMGYTAKQAEQEAKRVSPDADTVPDLPAAAF